ncbi:hypothetical protein C8A00DRAFT_44108 [Chaetomidium leptoderma]|uniref:Uncharacterized protein n=1 Tax=Chaetomidium leptoderma TaxID=669021 RepID=A0AAN6ZUX3_9PEZI|nr:hypothetical protein C8A00DRAFT_44108 [Chaetomidium leptoderma]
MDRPDPDEIALSDEDFYAESHNDDEAAQAAQEAATMAATLGFTSFGGTKATDDDDDDNDDDSSSRPTKKRRYNSHLLDHAVIAPPEPTPAIVTAHRAQLKDKDKPKKQPNLDEITYSDDDNDDFDLDTTAGAAAAPGAEADSTQSQLPSAGGSRNGRGSSLPNRPSNNPASSSFPTDRGGRGGTSRGGGGGARGGGRGGGGAMNPLWYVDYYDASSNENPWEGMEKFKGLESVGVWLSRFWDREKDGEGGESGGAAQGGEGVVVG